MKLNKNTEELFKSCRKAAEKLGNDYISVNHFLLVYNKHRTAPNDFRVSFTDIKEIIKILKEGKAKENNIELFPLTKDFEEFLRLSSFHRWVRSEKYISPKHIYLSILSNEITKERYLELLKEDGIKVSWAADKIISLYFHPLSKKLRLFKIIF